MGASGALLTIYCTVTEIAVECWIAPKVAVTVTVIVLRRLNFGDAVAASARRRAESWRPASRGSAPRVSGASCRSPSPERRPSIPAAATRRRVLLPARRQGQETPWQRACTISESCRSSCLKKTVPTTELADTVFVCSRLFLAKRRTQFSRSLVSAGLFGSD